MAERRLLGRSRPLTEIARTSVMRPTAQTASRETACLRGVKEGCGKDDDLSGAAFFPRVRRLSEEGSSDANYTLGLGNSSLGKSLVISGFLLEMKSKHQKR